VKPTPVPDHDRSQFSVTAFIGGMVFAFGMMAIGFIAFKFYKARNERNYHTL
jgi:CD164 antigen